MKISIARCWWLMPIILATQEAEIRRIVVPSQPGQRLGGLSNKHLFLIVLEAGSTKSGAGKDWFHGLLLGPFSDCKLPTSLWQKKSKPPLWPLLKKALFPLIRAPSS
jgi:hypothetical protein